MGELVRRLDYERRSRQTSLLRDGGGSGQRINKEYSATVRAANDMEERKMELNIHKMEKEKKLFLNRLAYEKKTILRFKNELDAKSQAFDESVFQKLRGRIQSAEGRLQTTPARTKAAVDEDPDEKTQARGVFRKLLTKPTCVKFDIGDSDSCDSISDSDSSSDEEKDSKLHPIKNFTRMSHSASFEMFQRRRISYAEFMSGVQPTEKPASAKNTRRLSAPPRVLGAYIPRDVSLTSSRRSSAATIRRDSKSSEGSVLTSSASGNELSSGSEGSESTSSSYRLLREAFKKKKVENTNPKEEFIKNMKLDHLNKTDGLYNRTLEKFDQLFSPEVFDVINR